MINTALLRMKKHDQLINKHVTCLFCAWKVEIENAHHTVKCTKANVLYQRPHTVSNFKIISICRTLGCDEVWKMFVEIGEYSTAIFILWT